MTVFDPGWDDESPDEPEEEPEAPMAAPAAILLDDDGDEPGWLEDAPHWRRPR